MNSESTTDWKQRVCKAEYWSRLVALFCFFWAIGVVTYLLFLTSDQPSKFMPLKMSEKDSIEQRQAAIDRWQPATLPNNIDALVRGDWRDTNFALNPELTAKYEVHADRPFKERLLHLNIHLSNTMLEYWEIKSYYQTVGFAAMFVVVLALIKPRVVTSLMLLTMAACGLPISAWIFNGPMPFDFADNTWLLYAPLLLISAIHLGIVIYRWYLIPQSTEIAHAWQMFVWGKISVLAGIGALIMLFQFGGRYGVGAGLLVVYGTYAMFSNWRKIGKYYRSQNEAVKHESSDPEV